MRTRLISETELTGLRELADEAEVLERRAKLHIQLMAREFDGTLSKGGLPTFKVTEEATGRILGRLTSQFGQGRFVLDLKTNGQAAEGALVVEKEIFGIDDRSTWVSVMRIPLPDPVWEMGNQKLGNSDKVFGLGASVLHAIINGPDKA